MNSANTHIPGYFAFYILCALEIFWNSKMYISLQAVYKSYLQNLVTTPQAIVTKHTAIRLNLFDKNSKVQLANNGNTQVLIG